MESADFSLSFFFNDTATTEIYTLSLHDALPICNEAAGVRSTNKITTPSSTLHCIGCPTLSSTSDRGAAVPHHTAHATRSEEHTSELQSRQYLVCRLLLEKTKKRN